MEPYDCNATFVELQAREASAEGDFFKYLVTKIKVSEDDVAAAQYGIHLFALKAICEINEVFTLDEEFKVTVTNSRTQAQEKAKATLDVCRNFESLTDDSSGESAAEKLDQLAQCMQASVQESIAKQHDEIEFQASTRQKLGTRLKDYACADPKFPTTMPLAVKEWIPNNSRLLVDDDSHTVNVLFQTDSIMIATIENLARPIDCDFVHEKAVKMEDGELIVPWEERHNPASLNFLSRVYAYVDPAVKMINLYARLPQKGESLFILYEDSDEIPHPPHLRVDGEWDIDGPYFGRLLMFCEVPDEGGGGAIHFPETGVHVHPKLGEGLLVTYSKPTDDQGFLETLRNEHYDCPILSGRRTIIQHQFRLFRNVIEGL
jgi:hypothetical protein